MHILGITPAQSLENLYEWLHNVVTSCVKDDGALAVVRYGTTQRRMPGFFHQLRQDEHSCMEAKISYFTDWASQCNAANVSAGTYVSVEGAGRGQCQMINKSLGPFKTIG